MSRNQTAPSARTILTHRQVDLDACMSVIMLMLLNKKEYGNARIVFVPTDWEGTIRDGDIAVDIYADGYGLKGKTDPDGTVHSAFSAVVEKFASKDDQRALAGLVKIIDDQDAYGTTRHYYDQDLDIDTVDALENCSIVGVFRCLKGTVGRGEGGDERMIEFMWPIIEGYLKNERSRVLAENIIEKGSESIMFSKSRQVVMLDNAPQNHRLNDTLFKRYGVRMIIAANDNNIAVIRGPNEQVRTDHPQITAIVRTAGELEKWFGHSSGFLYCHGSNKAPAKRPSRVNPMLLMDAAEKALRSA